MACDPGTGGGQCPRLRLQPRQGPPARGWDSAETDRAGVGAALACWPVPARWAEPPALRAYPGRRVAAPEPLRQRDVAGNLGAALAELPGVEERRVMARRAGDERRREMASEKARTT